MTDPDRDLAGHYFDRRLAAMSQLRDLAARVTALQAELAACRAAGRVARATEQHRHDTAPKETP